ncbi:hypothetical protein C8F04DRAFT_1186311 [Mycena alexandri]|uniref:Uncharacterized protein n=1 Tax=Mycena alexandri TaxID=1745969 RepID=A0AAD6SNW8_9AGAR|nr:hypothetical protein C8F04DRAFT_1186311 [Mycena alexandri]
MCHDTNGVKDVVGALQGRIQNKEIQGTRFESPKGAELGSTTIAQANGKECTAEEQYEVIFPNRRFGKFAKYVENETERLWATLQLKLLVDLAKFIVRCLLNCNSTRLSVGGSTTNYPARDGTSASASSLRDAMSGTADRCAMSWIFGLRTVGGSTCRLSSNDAFEKVLLSSSKFFTFIGSTRNRVSENEFAGVKRKPAQLRQCKQSRRSAGWGSTASPRSTSTTPTRDVRSRARSVAPTAAITPPELFPDAENPEMPSPESMRKNIHLKEGHIRLRASFAARGNWLERRSHILVIPSRCATFWSTNAGDVGLGPETRRRESYGAMSHVFDLAP